MATITRASTRAVALSLVLVLLSGGSLGAACVGWSDSAMTRMACCHGEGHQDTQAAADRCCAMGEQRRTGESPGTTAAAAPQALALPAFPHPAIPSVEWLAPRIGWDVDLPVGSPPHTHLLLSVFLI
jgi:hypothetical protein